MFHFLGPGKVKNNLSSGTGLSSSRIKEWLGIEAREEEEGRMHHRSAEMEGHRLGNKKQLKVSFKQLVYQRC